MIGGEAFGLILPQTEELGAMLVAAKQRIAVENAVISSERDPVQVTISARFAGGGAAGEG